MSLFCHMNTIKFLRCAALFFVMIITVGKIFKSLRFNFLTLQKKKKKKWTRLHIVRLHEFNRSWTSLFLLEVCFSEN